MNGLVKEISGLQIITTGQLPRMSDGQTALLKAMRECVSAAKPMSFDLIVSIYYQNVRQTYWTYKYIKGNRETIGLDVFEEYTNRSAEWTYGIRSNVRSWFISSIGALVLKNQLVVIPTIESNEL